MKTHISEQTREKPDRRSALGNWRWTPLIVVLACLSAANLTAATVVLFTNNFDAYPGAATSLVDTSDADPAVPEFNGTMADDNPVAPGLAGSGVQLINWDSHSSPHSLLLRAGTEARFNLDGPRTGTNYQWDFWVKITRTETTDRGFRVSMRAEGGDLNGDDYIAYRQANVTNSTGLENYDGISLGGIQPAAASAWVSMGTNYTPDTWQHHRIVINPLNRSFAFYLDDMVNAWTNGDLARTDAPLPVNIRIQHEGNTDDDGYFALDDMTLTVDGSLDITNTFTEGFEGYPARTGSEDDADPQGPWITVESDGTGAGKNLADGKVQVVTDSPRSGSKCLKLEAGQRAAVAIAWGQTPQSDVQITWWAKVPEAVAFNPSPDAVYLRMSIYGKEGGVSEAGDCALYGWGIRATAPVVGDATSLILYTTGWVDSGADYTPNVWEEFRLTTSVSQGNYTIIKNPSSVNPTLVVDRAVFIGSAVGPVFSAGWASSNGTNHPPVYIDDIEIKSLVNNSAPMPESYTPTITGSRFTNLTVLKIPGKVITGVTVDPRDNTSIIFADDSAGSGSIRRAHKVASGNWALDATPIVSGLDHPSGLAVGPNGTLWWTEDFTAALKRLSDPWATSVVEDVISGFGENLNSDTDDDPIALSFAPASFNGTLGTGNMLVIADRGSDGNAYNALYLVDPAITNGHTSYTNFLAGPDTFTLGTGELNAIAPLATSGEIVCLNQDATLYAVDGSGAVRSLIPTTLYSDPLLSYLPTGIAVDPTTGRIWVADDGLDEVWSVDSTTGTPTPDTKELTFPLTRPDRLDLQIDFNEPNMTFATNGAFLVVSDSSVANGGGRLLIFHNEAFVVAPFSITNTVRTGLQVQLGWEDGGAVKYQVQRGASLTTLTNYSGDLTARQYTDTNAVAGQLFYRVQATKLP